MQAANVSTLFDSLTEKNREIENLRSDILKMKREYSDHQFSFDQTVEDLVTKNTDLKSTVEKRELEFQAVNLRLLEIFIEKEAVSNNNKQLLEEKEKMQKVMYDMEQAVSRLQSEKIENRTSFSIEVAEFKTTFGQWMKLGQETEILLQEKSCDFEKIREKYYELESFISKQDASILSKNQELWGQLQFYKLEITKLESKLESLGFRCSGLDFKARNMETTLQEKQAAIEQLNNKCISLEHLVAEETSRHQSKIMELKTTTEKLENNAIKLEGEIGELKKSNKNMEEEQVLLKTKKEEIEAKLQEQIATANRNKVIYLHKLQKIGKLWKLEKKQRNEKLQEISAEANRMREQLTGLVKAKKYLNTIIESKLRNKRRSQDQDYVVSSTNPVSSSGQSKPKRKLSDVDHDESAEPQCNKTKLMSPTAEQNTKDMSTCQIELITLSDSEDV